MQEKRQGKDPKRRFFLHFLRTSTKQELKQRESRKGHVFIVLACSFAYVRLANLSGLFFFICFFVQKA